MIALTQFGDYIPWIVVGLLFFGGTVAAFFSRIGDILMTWAGRGRSLGKADRKEMERLRHENAHLRDVLREVQMYDAIAATPLTTELSQKVNQVLKTRELEAQKQGE